MRSIGIEPRRPTDPQPNSLERFGTNVVRPQGRRQDVAGQSGTAIVPVPTKNSVRVDFLDFSGRGQVALRR
jgi:hypothetical protein